MTSFILLLTLPAHFTTTSKKTVIIVDTCLYIYTFSVYEICGGVILHGFNLLPLNIGENYEPFQSNMSET